MLGGMTNLVLPAIKLRAAFQPYLNKRLLGWDGRKRMETRTRHTES